MTLEVGKYYRFRDAIFLAKMCEFCPRNQHRVRERCDEEHGKVMTSLHFLGILSKENKVGNATFNGEVFECNFKDDIYMYDEHEYVREATSAEVAQLVLGEV